MPLTYDQPMQDDIALRVSRRSYTSLTPDQKAIIDGAGIINPPIEGAVGRAWAEVSQWAAYRTMDESAGIPDEWRPWVVLSAAADAAGAFTSADPAELRNEANATRNNLLPTYRRSDPESTAASAHLGISTLEMRRYCLSGTLHQSTPLLPEPFLIDQAIQEAIARTWDYTDWNWRRQMVELTIATDGSVTVGGSLVLDRLTSDHIRYTSTNAHGATARHVDVETMMQATAYDQPDGRPELFRLYPADGGLQWIFERTPDEEYTAKAEAVTKVGALTTPAQMDAALALFPVDFHQYLKKRALANLYHITSRVTAADRLEASLDSDIRALAAQEATDRNAVYDQQRQRRYGMGRIPSGWIEGGFV